MYCGSEPAGSRSDFEKVSVPFPNPAPSPVRDPNPKPDPDLTVFSSV
jgi:hypothetical protein